MAIMAVEYISGVMCVINYLLIYIKLHSIFATYFMCGNWKWCILHDLSISTISNIDLKVIKVKGKRKCRVERAKGIGLVGKGNDKSSLLTETKIIGLKNIKKIF